MSMSFKTIFSVLKFYKKKLFHRIFQLFFNLLIAMNIIFVIFSPMSGIEWLFLSLFLVEILMKIYTFGFKEFISDYWNM
jgi:two pore calcium channel protein 3